MIDIGVNAALGKSIKEQGYGTGLAPTSDLVCVKVPVFSFQKLNRIDPALAPEMKSTGEVLGVDRVYEKALVKGFLAAGYSFPERRGDVMLSLNDHTKGQCDDIAADFAELGYRIVATTGTHKYLESKGIPSKEIAHFDLEKMQAHMKKGQLCFVINTPTTNGNSARIGSENRGFLIRTIAEMYSTPCFTSIDTARAYLRAMKYKIQNPEMTYEGISEYKNSKVCV